jgi:hypothetical protein
MQVPYTKQADLSLFSEPGLAKMCMKRRELTNHTQRASYLLRSKPAAFALWA